MSTYFNDPEYIARVDREAMANPSLGPDNLHFLRSTGASFGLIFFCIALAIVVAYLAGRYFRRRRHEIGNSLPISDDPGRQRGGSLVSRTISKVFNPLNSPVKRAASLIAFIGLLVLMVDIVIFLSFHGSHTAFWDSQIRDYGRPMYRSYAIWGYVAGMLILFGLLGSIFYDATVHRVIGWIRNGSR